jgi:heme exporter protein D
MSWNSWPDFFAMGGYGLYVWGSLGMCSAVIIAEVILLKARHLSLVREVSAEASQNVEEAKL